MAKSVEKSLFKRAKKYIPGGVNSPVRAFKSVGGEPIFFAYGKGSRIYSATDQPYIDYVGSWGSLILGHAHPKIIKAVQNTASKGLSFGAPTELETQMAEKICQLMPSIEKVRMVNSGTEAAMSAIRLARGFTNRDKIIKFEGCYHGHVDALLVKAGSGALTLGVATSAGIPADTAQNTIVLDYNNPQQLQSIFDKIGTEIAAVIVEPMAGNMNYIPATPLFLNTLKSLCTQYASLLIFDEVMSGFRVALGGAQSIYNIIPDLTILGKVIGGGLPVGAFGGRREIMDNIAPDGQVYQAGTLSGNPLTMAAGLATLNIISEKNFFTQLEASNQLLLEGLQKLANAAGIAFSNNLAGGMFGLFFGTEHQVSSFSQLMQCDQKQFCKFFHGMLKQGIYFAPSPFEAGFISKAHSEEDLEITLTAAEKVMATL